MEHYDPIANLRHWPLEPMARFGQNPFGENLWRIVHAPSRRSLAHGQGMSPKWLPTYPQIGNAWILEQWVSAYDFAKCAPEVWNMSMTILGPYPSRGEYEWAWTFAPAPAADCDVEQIVSWVRAGKEKYSAAENLTAIKEDADKEQREGQRLREAQIRNLLPAFGAAPMSGYRGGRNTKTFDFPYAAPVPRVGAHKTASGQKQYDVSHLITA